MISNIFLKHDLIFKFFIIVSPLFLLTIKHWTNLLLLAISIGAIYFLLVNRSVILISQKSYFKNKWFLAITVSFAGPFLAVFLGQFLRNDFSLQNYDAPIRLILCIPIFLAISFGWLNSNSKPISIIWIQYIYTSSLIFIFFYRNSWSAIRGPNRITTYFVDPISFGSITLLFALLSFSALTFFWNEIKNYFKIYILLSILIGIYLSVMSSTRSGWIFIPLYVMLWMYYIALNKFGKNKSIFLAALFLVVIISFFHFQPILINKIREIHTELSNYHWNEINSDTSIGMRISFYRMGVYYFFQSPFSGWGDLGWMSLMNSSDISYYASEFTRKYPVNGFHNEFITSAVRSGVFGLISSLSLFLTPLFVVIFNRNNVSNNSQIIISFSLTVFCLFQFTTGLTTEVTHLIFLSSFTGLTLAIFLGELFFLVNKSTAK